MIVSISWCCSSCPVCSRRHGAETAPLSFSSENHLTRVASRTSRAKVKGPESGEASHHSRVPSVATTRATVSTI